MDRVSKHYFRMKNMCVCICHEATATAWHGRNYSYPMFGLGGFGLEGREEEGLYFSINKELKIISPFIPFFSL